MLREILKSAIRRSPTLRRWALVAKHRLRPTAIDRCEIELSRRTKSITHPVFVKVGGNDRLDCGRFGEAIVGDRRWSGILIESDPFHFENLKSTYQDHSRFTTEHAEINAAPGFRAFFYFSHTAAESLPNLPYWFDRIGSFDKQDLLRCLGGDLEPFIAEVQIAMRPLSEVLAQHQVRTIDFLLIDTRGEALQVLKTIDFMTLRPAAIFIEHKRLSDTDRTEMRTVLEVNNYSVRDCGTAFFAVTPPDAAMS